MVAVMAWLSRGAWIHDSVVLTTLALTTKKAASWKPPGKGDGSDVQKLSLMEMVNGRALTASEELARGVVSGWASAAFQPPKTPVTKMRASPASIVRLAGDARSEKSLKNRQIPAPRVEPLLVVAPGRS